MASWISSFEASNVRSSPFNEAGLEGGGSSERGGGGRGALFASPIRSRVMVSWAFVGIPLRSELEKVSLGFHFWGHFDILFKFKIFLPVWNLAVQEVEATPDQWVAKEAKAHSSVSGFHEHRGGGE